MGMENLTCFGCGGKGHVERECPTRVVVGVNATDKPMWCGRCDRRTRLIEVGGLATRCVDCHPLAHQGLPQTTRCAGCRAIVYEWDTAQCGQHASPARSGDERPERGEIDAIIAREMANEDREAANAELHLHNPPKDAA